MALFSWGGLGRGGRRAAPLMVSVAAYGLVFGVLARSAGVPLVAAVLMSAIVCAGASQFAVLDLWANPLPMLLIIVTTLIVNLRHLLMGATLERWLSPLRRWQQVLNLTYLSDESWALTVLARDAGEDDRAFLFGASLAMTTAWTGATWAGHALGALIAHPEAWGLDFAFTAVFLALLVGMYRSRSNLLPWAVAALTAALTAQLIEGKWYILVGGLAGSLVGAWRNAE